MFKFERHEMTEMAEFVAELVRQGIAYCVVKMVGGGYQIEPTGC